MKEKVYENIIKYHLIKEGDTILVGASGGGDSQSLIYLLDSLRERLSFTLCIAHVHHCIRGVEADEDQLLVEKTAKELGLRYYKKKIDVPAYAQRHRLTVEEAGRKVRYEYFNEIIKGFDSGKVAVAHNQNDQSETILMRIIRGTGIDGLRGMEFISGNIIRPLLNIPRSEIDFYLKEEKISYRTDQTNADRKYTRNFLRLEVLPLLEELNPNIVATLFQLGEVTKSDTDILYQVVEEAYHSVCKKEESEAVVFDLIKMRAYSEGMRQRIMRYGIQKLLGNLQGFTLKHIEEFDRLLEAKTGSVKEINGIRVNVSYGELFMEKADRSVPYLRLRPRELFAGETLCLEEAGGYLRAELLEPEEFQTMNKSHKVYFDYDKIEGDLVVRSREEGDFFYPFGMTGSKKIKNFFIDAKIPGEQRGVIPLVVDSKNILWIVPYRRSDLYKVDERTQRILMLEFIQGGLHEHL